MRVTPAELGVYQCLIIDAQAASGLSKHELFKDNNINPATYYWFKKNNSLKKKTTIRYCLSKLPHNYRIHRIKAFNSYCLMVINYLSMLLLILPILPLFTFPEVLIFLEALFLFLQYSLTTTYN